LREKNLDISDYKNLIHLIINNGYLKIHLLRIAFEELQYKESNLNQDITIMIIKNLSKLIRCD